ncbi:MAG: (2Fe-2S)-binding protein [Elusimicrobia bacterium]|nr:(2Fe-2S)-binding protein [Elusimicrobiota bacterium]
MTKFLLDLKVNGRRRRLRTRPHKTLLEILREDLGLTGTKHGCELGECGACTVLLNGKSVYSCLVLAPQARGGEVLTIEGVPPEHPLIRAFVATGAVQCGYCTPGMILAAKAFLDRNPTQERTSWDREALEAVSGNLCRCTGYAKILEAVRVAAGKKSRRR